MYNVWTHQLGTHDGLLQVLSSTGQSTQCSPKGCNRYRKREREREATKEIEKFYSSLSFSVPREYQDSTVKGPSSSSKVDFKFGVKRRRRSPLPQKSKHSLVMGGVGGGDGEAGSLVDAGESVDEFYNEGSDSPPEKRKKRKHEGIITTQ